MTSVKKKMTLKRLLAAILSFTLLLSLVNLTAFAVEDGSELICGLEESEGHTHTGECYESTLICELEEHTHTAACQELPDGSLEAEPICGLTEHTHGESCYTRTLTCGIEEAAGHTHTPDCYAPAEPEPAEELPQGATGYRPTESVYVTIYLYLKITGDGATDFMRQYKFETSNPARQP